MAANHTALQVEGQDLFEDQLRASDTRSVRHAGLVLARHPPAIGASGTGTVRLPTTESSYG